ncbi:hypothetical protein [Gallaecimonas mangrovi]|uniref:hypothetical protein n=1 Tax=Gallaecimonas mangrovi TaxID=2291597 RepID=UPI000E1FEE07|nr:hypothetical protein [Gallaecimonas mangrovi]
MFKWLWRLLLLSLFSSVLVSSLLFLALYQTYQRLGSEVPVAWVQFQKLAPEQFQLQLTTPHDCIARQFPLRGDDWRLDARFIKWPNWLTVLGFEPQYRLERIEGRFRDIDKENSVPHHAYALSPKTWVKPAWLDKLTFLIDTDYGSSVYAPMDANKGYVVYRSHSGLFVRQAKAATTQKSPLSCQSSRSVLGPLALWMDRQFQTLFQG